MSKVDEDGTCSELLRAQAHIWNQTYSYLNLASLACAVQLGIPDIIHSHGKPMTLVELAHALPINKTKARSLPQLMRVLVNSGFFSQENSHKEENDGEDDSFNLTAASRLLLKDEPISARTFVLAYNNPTTLKPFQILGDWFSNDDPTPFDTTYGMSVYEYGEKYPAQGSLINKLMAEDSRLISKVLMTDYKGVFEGLASLVDIAGGTGTMARSIAKTFANLKCTVFDLPHVVADLEGTENLEFVGGNMFEAIPTANAILLKWILHNWSDEDCVKILKKCKEAIPSKEMGGKIIIIDMVMEKKKGENNDSYRAQCFFDMSMMVLHGSKERTKKEWVKLFSDAGLSHYKITPLLGVRSIIEAYP